uniref:Uncharacterized protein n=1 Tax=Globisporangium ultimum (strain ATCC 200006 / CBS 805.95 / DAOM BR144) TaxID=431595 RepID=K3WMD6_GLOUD
MKKQKLAHDPSVAAAAAPAMSSAPATALPKHLLKYLFSFVARVMDFAHVPVSVIGCYELIPYVALVRALEFEIVLETAQLGELEEIYQDLEARGGTLRELGVDMGDPHNNRNDRFTLAPQLVSLKDVDAKKIDWERIFRACPRLLRLDLFSVPLDCNHIEKILDASSKYCPDLESLIFPLKETRAEDSDNDVGDRDDNSDGEDVGALLVISKLYEALERWHTKGSKGGLIQLSVPKHHRSGNDNLLERSNEFLTAVSRFCPNIEYLDGWRDTYSDENGMRCDEMWFCSLDVWKMFCATCTKLREFNWFTAPFDDDFLNEFAVHPKPNLTKMTITCGNDGVYSEDYNGGVYYRPDGFRFTMSCVGSMLTACPALEELHVVFEEDGDLSRCLKKMVNDDFLRAVVEHCPKLKRFVIDEILDIDDETPMERITDEGLLLIAKLPFLERLALKQTRCSYDALLALITKAPSPKLRRQIALKMGFVNPKSEVLYYDAVTRFLTFLAAQPAESLRHRRFELKLDANYSGERLAAGHHAGIERKLTALQARVQEQHPGVQVYFRTRYAMLSLADGIVDDIESIILISPARAKVSGATDFDTTW